MQNGDPIYTLQWDGPNLALAHICEQVGAEASLKTAGIASRVASNGTIVVLNADLDSVISALGFDRPPFEVELQGDRVLVYILPNPEHSPPYDVI